MVIGAVSGTGSGLGPGAGPGPGPTTPLLYGQLMVSHERLHKLFLIGSPRARTLAALVRTVAVRKPLIVCRHFLFNPLLGYPESRLPGLYFGLLECQCQC